MTKEAEKSSQELTFGVALRNFQKQTKRDGKEKRCSEEGTSRETLLETECCPHVWDHDMHGERRQGRDRDPEAESEERGEGRESTPVAIMVSGAHRGWSTFSKHTHMRARTPTSVR